MSVPQRCCYKLQCAATFLELTRCRQGHLQAQAVSHASVLSTVVVQQPVVALPQRLLWQVEAPGLDRPTAPRMRALAEPGLQRQKMVPTTSVAGDMFQSLHMVRPSVQFAPLHCHTYPQCCYIMMHEWAAAISLRRFQGSIDFSLDRPPNDRRWPCSNWHADCACMVSFRVPQV